MKQGRRNRKRNGVSLPSGIVFGILFAVVVVFLEAMFCAFLLNNETAEQSAMAGMVPMLLGVASCAGCFCASKKVGGQRIVVAGVTSLGLWLVLLGIPALFFDGQYGRAGLGLLGILIGGLAGLWLSTRRSKRKYR